MDCRIKGVDASSFFLLEDSGDSEADSDPLKISQDIGKAAGIDDAESCSSDSSDTNDHDKDFGAAAIDNEGDINYKEPASLISGRKMLLSAAGDAGAESISKKEEEEEESISRVVGEVMDEMEDRVFWETCLAQ